MPKLGSAGSLWRRRGTYYGVWYRNGARFSENLHTGDESEARSELARRIAACEDSNQLRPERTPPGVGLMLAEVVRYYRRLDRRSTEHVERHAGRLKKAFRGLRADELTRGRVNDYTDRRRGEHAANGTINRELAVLRLAYSLARKGGKIKAEMIPTIELLPENNRRTGFFEQEQYEAVLAHLPDYLKGVLTMGYWTGMRKEEILGLTWDRVDLFARLVRLEKTKNGEDRTLPLNDELFAMFKAQDAQKWEGCPYVFHHGPKRIRDFRKAWATALRLAGLPSEAHHRKLVHDLRRTGVRNLIRAGVPQSVAMRISGHKDARIFARYDITDTRDLADAMRKLALYEQQKRQARLLGSLGFTEGENETKTLTLPVTVH